MTQFFSGAVTSTLEILTLDFSTCKASGMFPQLKKKASKHTTKTPNLFFLRLRSTQTFKQATHNVEQALQSNILLVMIGVGFGRNFFFKKKSK